MLIFYGGMVTGFFVVRRPPPLVEAPAYPFIGPREGRDVGGALGVKFYRAL
jgi:hypothetical protein